MKNWGFMLKNRPSWVWNTLEWDLIRAFESKTDLRYNNNNNNRSRIVLTKSFKWQVSSIFKVYLTDKFIIILDESYFFYSEAYSIKFKFIVKTLE